MAASLCTCLLVSLIRLTLWICRTLPFESDNTRVYSRAWNWLYPNALVRTLLPYCSNKYALNEKEYIYLQLLDQMLACHLEMVPELSISQPELIAEACAHFPSFVVVSAHSGLAFSTRVLIEFNREVAVIVKNPASRKLSKTFRKSGITSNVHLIAKDKYSLFKMREAVMAGKVVSCDIDFKCDRRDWCDAVSPALFTFANKIDLPVYFARNEISEDGAATVIFDGPYRQIAPEECARRFIRFLGPSHLPGRGLTVRNYDKNRLLLSSENEE